MFASTLNRLGALYRAHGRYPAAEPSIKRALPMAQEAGEPVLLRTVQAGYASLLKKQRQHRSRDLLRKAGRQHHPGNEKQRRQDGQGDPQELHCLRSMTPTLISPAFSSTKAASPRPSRLSTCSRMRNTSTSSAGTQARLFPIQEGRHDIPGGRPRRQVREGG